jgi:hypothetical protein
MHLICVGFFLRIIRQLFRHSQTMIMVTRDCCLQLLLR